MNEWVEDTPKIIGNCVRHDLAAWKIDKITEDPQERKQIASVISKYYQDLKEIFVRAVVETGNPPDFKKREFFQFC